MPRPMVYCAIRYTHTIHSRALRMYSRAWEPVLPTVSGAYIGYTARAYIFNVHSPSSYKCHELLRQIKKKKRNQRARNVGTRGRAFLVSLGTLLTAGLLLTHQSYGTWSVQYSAERGTDFLFILSPLILGRQQVCCWLFKRSHGKQFDFFSAVCINTTHPTNSPRHLFFGVKYIVKRL